MKKILVIGLKNNKNLGDVIISDCVYFLLRKIFKELQYSNYQITSIDMMDKHYDMIKKFNLIVFAGGGIIKYKYQEFYLYLDEITKIAEEAGVPIIMNAVGIEGYDQNDINCILLKNALNRSCIKQITTRDDINLLNTSYIENQNIVTKKVADPAVWVKETYGINKNKATDIVGLGVVREGIFRSNGIDLGLEELLLLWSDIIDELERTNQEWRIFTTGWPSDMKFAINLMRYLDREHEIPDKILTEPSTPLELINNISNFKGVIAGRLHASIVSYALDIPSIGIVWNEKCAFWSNNIGYPERFFRPEFLNGKEMVKQLTYTFSQNYQNKEEYMNTVYDSLYDYIKVFIGR